MLCGWWLGTDDADEDRDVQLGNVEPDPRGDSGGAAGVRGPGGQDLGRSSSVLSAGESLRVMSGRSTAETKGTSIRSRHSIYSVFRTASAPSMLDE
jgi:hypothetical protein